MRTEGRVHFANAAGRRQGLAADSRDKRRGIAGLQRDSDIEYTALKMLTDAEASCGRLELHCGWPRSTQKLRTLQRSSLGKTLGRERLFFNVEQAAAAYQAKTDSAWGSRRSPHLGGWDAMGRA